MPSWFDRIRFRGKASLGTLRQAANQFGLIEHGSNWSPVEYGNYYVTSVPAYRAVQVRSDAIASARLVVGEETIGESGRKEFVPVDDTHEAQDLLDRVNPWYTRGDMWRQTEAYLCLFGAAYWHIAPSNPRSIWGLHPSQVSVIPGSGPGPEQWVDHFEFHVGGRVIKLKTEEVLWFRRFNPNEEFSGLSHVAPARLGLDMGHEALLYNRQFFKNGVQLNSVAFEIPGGLAPEEIEAFYKRLDDRYRGAKNAHRPILVPAGTQAGVGVKVQNLGFSQKDMEFLASLNWTVADAARSFGVPPPMLYAETQSKYANVHEWNGDFWRSTIMPEWDYLAATVQERLLPLLGFPDLTCRFDYTDNLAIQESMQLLRDADRNDVSAGILTVNEVRESRGLPPVPWGDAPSNPFMDAETGGPQPPPEDPNKKPDDPPFKSYRKFTAPQMTPDYLARAFGQRQDRYESEFSRLQKRLFTEQARAVSNRIAPGIPVSSVFNAAEWINRFSQEGMPLYQTVMGASGEEVGRRFGLFATFGPNAPASFNLKDPQVQQWLRTRVELWSTLVNEETGRLITQEVNEANAAGESIREVQERLERVGRFNSSVRTERIARTEMLSTANQGHLSAYEQSGVVRRIRWLSARDSRVRDTHRAADGQTVELGESFTVGSARLDAPGVGQGGTIAPPEETVNCRCVTIPVLEQRSAFDYRTASVNGHK